MNDMEINGRHWRHCPVNGHKGVFGWYFRNPPGSRNVDYCLELRAEGWFIEPDRWSYAELRIGPYETPEAAAVALDTIVGLGEAPKLEQA